MARKEECSFCEPATFDISQSISIWHCDSGCASPAHPQAATVQAYNVYPKGQDDKILCTLVKVVLVPMENKWLAFPARFVFAGHFNLL